LLEISSHKNKKNNNKNANKQRQQLTSMDSGPKYDGKAHATVQGQEVSIGESESMEHRTTKDKEKDHTAGSHGSITTSESNVGCGREFERRYSHTGEEKKCNVNKGYEKRSLGGFHL
jgi:hypothetical protein